MSANSHKATTVVCITCKSNRHRCFESFYSRSRSIFFLYFMLINSWSGISYVRNGVVYVTLHWFYSVYKYTQSRYFHFIVHRCEFIGESKRVNECVVCMKIEKNAVLENSRKTKRKFLFMSMMMMMRKWKPIWIWKPPLPIR